MAETVGKHFLSAAFFQMACESKAEPFRNLKVELKKYLARHVYLNEEDKWRNLSIGYGLAKEENITGEEKDAVHANENATRSVQEEDKPKKPPALPKFPSFLEYVWYKQLV